MTSWASGPVPGRSNSKYRDQRYDEAAKNFEEAAKKLTGHPLQGRVLLGQAVSLIKSG